jgi:hypothetical protein
MTDSSLTETFYAPPNEIDPSQLEGVLGDLLGLLISRLQLTTLRTLLPARVGGVIRWYGLAPSDREARLLREEVRCWLGPPISSGMINVGTSADHLDREALRLVPDGAVVRVDVAHGWQGDARSNVASLTDIWSLAPERSMDQPRPVGRVLRQFYESILAVDRDLAEVTLDEIRARALLSPTNIRFLRLELLSALGTPHEIRADPTLRGISMLARPPAVTERLAAAADAILIEPVLALRGPTANWIEVAEQLEDLWPGLATHREQVTTLATARCLVLRELVVREPRQSLLNELATQFADDPVVSTFVIRSVTEIGSPRESESSLSLYHDGDYWSALLAAEAEALGRSSVSVAFAAAVNLGDSASAVRALEMLEQLQVDDRNQLLGHSVERAFYEQLLARTSDARLPSDWLDWLKGSWSDRPDLLAEWSREWPLTSDVFDREAGPLAEELLDALNDHRRGRIRNGLPIFIDWLVREELPPSGVALATTIFDILLSSEPGRTERLASLALLEEALIVGCTAQEYGELVDAVTRQLPLLGPRDATWLAQCLDLFLLFTSYDPSRRRALFSDAAGTASGWVERLEAADASILRFLFADAGVTFGTPSIIVDGVADTVTARTFHTVGIYSLLESATRVASRWIQDLFPGVDIRTSSGHVNSASLTALVRATDVMLVQTSHAKHAATQAIDAAALESDRVVLVHGRGATSLVRALLAWSRREERS